MNIRIQCLCIDTGDPARIASFWQAALVELIRADYQRDPVSRDVP